MVKVFFLTLKTIGKQVYAYLVNSQHYPSFYCRIYICVNVFAMELVSVVAQNWTLIRSKENIRSMCWLWLKLYYLLTPTNIMQLYVNACIGLVLRLLRTKLSISFGSDFIYCENLFRLFISIPQPYKLKW